jgi:hypothetical protein
MTEHPDPAAPVRKADAGESTGDAEESTGDAEESTEAPPRPSRRRVRRRAERPGTNPSADDAPDVVPPRSEPKPGETQHDRWLREQRPPHWE